MTKKKPESMAAKRRRERREEADSYTKVLCCSCHQFFMQARQCMDNAYWNWCPECNRRESAAVRAELAAKGIVI